MGAGLYHFASLRALALALAVVSASPQPRITLELYKADVHNVLRLLAEVGHINIAVDDGVKGTVTLKLRNVQWQVAQKQREAAPLRTQIIPVNYARAADLVPLIKGTLGERGTVTYDARTNVLIVRDVN